MPIDLDKDAVAINTAGPACARRSTIMLWDGPNMLTTLRNQCGAEAPIRFQYEHILDWLCRLDGNADEVSATVFVNVAEKNAPTMRSFVHAVRQLGMAVHARPKSTQDSDIDDDVVTAAMRSSATTIVLATHDKELIDRVVATGDRRVIVVGIREISRHAVEHVSVDFLDLEDIDDAVDRQIPRIADLTDLPAEGRLFPALRTLRRIAD